MKHIYNYKIFEKKIKEIDPYGEEIWNEKEERRRERRRQIKEVLKKF